jgi:1,2-diacylglycerol 3-beta-galactosyltransferase
MDDKPKSILILTGDAGFGHRRAAEAIKAAFTDLVPDYNVTIENPAQDPDLPEMLRRVESGYDDIVKDDPTLYQLAYAATDAPVVAQLMQDIATTALNRAMRNVLTRQMPDAIVTTYPAYTQSAFRTARELGITAPIDVVVTDLVGVHSLWFHDKVAQTFVPTGQVYRQALDQGLTRSSVQLTGLPVNPRIAREKRSRSEIRTALGWDQELVTALVVGSARSGQTANITRLLDRSGLNLQVVAVAGGDQETEEALKEIEWKGTVHTYGLINNMSEFMRAADFIVCKAGGLIVTESLACGLPLILHEALPGQEVGNVKYVVDSGAGVWSPGPIGVLTTAYAWLAKDRSELEKCRQAALQVGKPRAAYDVAERVLRQIQNPLSPEELAEN